MKKQALQSIKILVLGLAIGISGSFALAQWAPPPGAPSSATNTPQPILGNVGTVSQTKTGELIVTGGFLSSYPSVFGDIFKIIHDGDSTQGSNYTKHPIQIEGSAVADQYGDTSREYFDIGVDSARGVSYLQSTSTRTGGTGPSIIALNPQGGNVGIGTITPASALSVVGSISSSNLAGSGDDPVCVSPASYVLTKCN